MSGFVFREGSELIVEKMLIRVLIVTFIPMLIISSSNGLLQKHQQKVGTPVAGHVTQGEFQQKTRVIKRFAVMTNAQKNAKTAARLRELRREIEENRRFEGLQQAASISGLRRRYEKYGPAVPYHPITIAVTPSNSSSSNQSSDTITLASVTMSESLDTYFRPIDGNVPRDHLVPFQEFGKKLRQRVKTTTINTNTLESTTHRSSKELSSNKRAANLAAEDETHEEMDVAFSRAYTEQNKVSRPHHIMLINPAGRRVNSTDTSVVDSDTAGSNVTVSKVVAPDTVVAAVEEQTEHNQTENVDVAKSSGGQDSAEDLTTMKPKSNRTSTGFTLLHRTRGQINGAKKNMTANRKMLKEKADNNLENVILNSTSRATESAVRTDAAELVNNTNDLDDVVPTKVKQRGNAMYTILNTSRRIAKLVEPDAEVFDSNVDVSKVLDRSQDTSTLSSTLLTTESATTAATTATTTPSTTPSTTTVTMTTAPPSTTSRTPPSTTPSTTPSTIPSTTAETTPSTTSSTTASTNAATTPSSTPLPTTVTMTPASPSSRTPATVTMTTAPPSTTPSTTTARPPATSTTTPQRATTRDTAAGIPTSKILSTAVVTSISVLGDWSPLTAVENTTETRSTPVTTVVNITPRYVDTVRSRGQTKETVQVSYSKSVPGPSIKVNATNNLSNLNQTRRTSVIKMKNIADIMNPPPLVVVNKPTETVAENTDSNNVTYPNIFARSEPASSPSTEPVVTQSSAAAVPQLRTVSSTTVNILMIDNGVPDEVKLNIRDGISTTEATTLREQVATSRDAGGTEGGYAKNHRHYESTSEAGGITKENGEKARKEEENKENARKEEGNRENARKEEEAEEKARKEEENKENARKVDTKEEENKENARKEEENRENTRKEENIGENVRKEDDIGEDTRKVDRKEEENGENVRKEDDIGEKARKEEENRENTRKEEDIEEKARKEEENARKEEDIEEKARKEDDIVEDAVTTRRPVKTGGTRKVNLNARDRNRVVYHTDEDQVLRSRNREQGQEDGNDVAVYILGTFGIIPVAIAVLLTVRYCISRRKKIWESEKSPLTFVSTNEWEFPRSKLRLQTVLGQGNFGLVYKAEADDILGERATRLVAVKTIKDNASSQEKEDLMRELVILKQIGAHSNVVTLLGCCTEKEPTLLILEYVMYGKLLSFLRDNRTRKQYYNFSEETAELTAKDLTSFAYCVARGMEYLTSKGIIHRDLAARNILVDHNKICKVADFGMSRSVSEPGQIYEQAPVKGALPIRWMAPESLTYRIFTHKSDVWAFGILMWEIVTLGSTPYQSMCAREVIRQVRDGYRLERPTHCRAELYRVAATCWSHDPSQRPTFTDIKHQLAQLLEQAESHTYVDLESYIESICNSRTHQTTQVVNL